MSLKEYRRKRDFSKTAEPGAMRGAGRQSRFVIQKHAATNLHYDLRLETEGVMKSWAVPKGMPLQKGEKRLAIEVEDHPLSYMNFEGTIPKGQYGGGTVMVWDRGSYELEGKSLNRELAAGKAHFKLHGEKLEGEWYLVRMRQGKQWLLIRKGDDVRPFSKKLEDSSALSGKSMKQLGDGSMPVWGARVTPKAKATTPKPRSLKVTSPKTRPVARKRLSQPLAFVEPMLAQLVKRPPAGDWQYEIKFDGFRALAIKEGDRVQLLSRNEKDFSERFPEVADSLRELKVATVVLDGEIVALDGQGRSSFQLLQARELGRSRPPIFFYAFDVLRWEDQDLTGEPLEERKKRLEQLLKKPPGIIRCSSSLGNDGEALMKQAARLGLEGLIGKRADSHYEAGRRSGAWVKLKLHHEQEFVIGGYTDPEGSRKYFGALLIGFYKGRQLQFAGKVGTGFDAKLLKALHARFAPLVQEECPFANLPEQARGRYGAGVTRSEMKRCHWVRPELVCQLKFTEWTQDAKLRHPVFLGLREDKAARAVTREKTT